MKIEGIEIERYGHDTFKFALEEKVIYLDPFILPKDPAKADLILVTHEHRDHCDPEKIKQLLKEDTIFVAPASCSSKISGEIKIIKPGEKIVVKGIEVEAVWAYNLNKFRSPGVPFHPRSEDFVGFIFTLGGKRIYHAGDTDHIPEMAHLKNIDIALLPVSGKYVMTTEEAVEAAKTLNPRIAIPMHYDAGVAGSEKDAESFKNSLANSGIKVEIVKGL